MSMADKPERSDAAAAGPRVSVVMPCYNGMPYVREALDSAMAQTHRPHEIIVVDDGSTDESAAFVTDYAAARGHELAGGIKLIQQANAGEPAARNAGIGASCGQWVAALDSDDWWEPQKLAKQLAAAGEAGEDCVLVHTGVLGHLPDGRVNEGPLDAAARRTGGGAKLIEALMGEGSIGHPSILVRRSALDAIGGYDESFKQACDIDLYFRLAAVGTFVIVPDRLLHYRYHDKQMSEAKVVQMRYHFMAVRHCLAANPEIARRIGPERVNELLSGLVGKKLESYYWRRRLNEFRELLGFAHEQGLDSEAIRQWRKRAAWPNWLIRLKDRISRAAQQQHSKAVRQ